MPRFLTSGSHRLDLAEREDACLVDGNLRDLGNLYGAIVRRLLKEHPTPVSKDGLSALLSHHHRAPDGVPKAIHELNKLMGRLGLPKVAEAVNGRGYRVAETWCVHDAVGEDITIAEPLEELSDLVKACVDRLAKLQYVDAPSGVQYLSVSAQEACANFNRFNDARQRIVWALSILPMASGSLIMKLNAELRLLQSYVTYDRMATRHEEFEWKEEYRFEVTAIMRVINQLTTIILEGAGQAHARALLLTEPAE